MVKIKARTLKEARRKALNRKGIFVKLSSGHLVEKAKGKRGLNTYEFEMKKDAKPGKMVKVEAKNYHGTSKNRHLDEMRPALPPGKRISKNGKVYYESRANHSDWPETRKVKKVKVRGKRKKSRKRR